MRGTFFLTPAMGAASRPEDWRAACRRGHEIGNHTWDHPCDQLPLYTAEQFEVEQTGRTEQWLNDYIGLHGVPGRPDGLRTYAYICANQHLGPGTDEEARQRYLELVRRTFWAARGVGDAAATRQDVLASPYAIPSLAPTVDHAAAAIQYCEQAAVIGGWAVLCLHTIIDTEPGPGSYAISRDDHAAILDYLAERQSRFWVAPFREVYRHIASGG